MPRVHPRRRARDPLQGGDSPQGHDGDVGGADDARRRQGHDGERRLRCGGEAPRTRRAGCCQAMTASCVACSLGISVEELCMVRPKDFFDRAGVADEVVVTLPVVAPPPPPPVFDARDTSDLDSIRATTSSSRARSAAHRRLHEAAGGELRLRRDLRRRLVRARRRRLDGQHLRLHHPAAVNYRPLATLSNGKCNFAGAWTRARPTSTRARRCRRSASTD